MKTIITGIVLLIVLALLSSGCRKQEQDPCISMPNNAVSDEPTGFSVGCIKKYDKVHWGFGDGSSSQEANTTHIYDTSGVYNVTLSVFTKKGRKDVSRSLTVGPGTYERIQGFWNIIRTDAVTYEAGNPVNSSTISTGGAFNFISKTEVVITENAQTDTVTYNTWLDHARRDVITFYTQDWIVRATDPDEQGQFQFLKIENYGSVDSYYWGTTTRYKCDR